MPDVTEGNVNKYYLDSPALSKIVEAILTKVKDYVKQPLMVKDLTETDLEVLLLNIRDNLNSQNDADIVSVDLLAEILNSLELSSVQVVSGDSIEEAAVLPNSKNLYIFSATDDPDNYGFYVYKDDKWVTIIAPKSKNDITLIDTTKADSVDNVVAHVNRKDSSYAGSANAQPEEAITVQALTNILIALSYSKTQQIPYVEANKDKLISEVVTKPSANTIYVYQESEDETDWSVWTVATTELDGQTKFNWVKISGKEGSSSGVEVNLSNYWSKDELVAITDEEITAIVDAAADKVGF